MTAQSLLQPLGGTEEICCHRHEGNTWFFADGLLHAPNRPVDHLTVGLLNPAEPTIRATLNAAMVNSLSRLGALILHACAFRLYGRNILALGASGAGKSTLSAAAWSAGGKILSDDSVLLDVTDHQIMGYPFGRDISLRPGCLAMLKTSERDALTRQHNGREYKWFLPRASRPQAYLDALSPDELWLLTPPTDHLAPTKRHMSAAETLTHLMEANPYLASTQVVERHATTRPATILATQLPSFQVDLGTRLLSAPASTLRACITPREATFSAAR